MGEHEDDNNNLKSKSIKNHHPHNYSHHHHHQHHFRHGHYNYHHSFHNYHRKGPLHRINTTPTTTLVNNVNNINNKVLYYNERLRKLNALSIIDTSSLINLPLNTKTLYFNLHNSFIKTRDANNSKNSSNNGDKSKTVNLISYLKYLLNRNLFLNFFIFLINFTYSISLIGKSFDLLIF